MSDFNWKAFDPETREEEMARLREQFRGHPFFNGPLYEDTTPTTSPVPTSPVPTRSLSDVTRETPGSVSTTFTETGSIGSKLSYDTDPEFSDMSEQIERMNRVESAHAFEPLPLYDTLHPRIAPADRTGMELVRLRTNMFPLRVDPNRVVYRYDVCVDLVISSEERGEKIISLNRGPKDDSEMARRNEAIRTALQRALEVYRILTETGVTVFDGTNILFSNESLAAALKPYSETLTLTMAQLPPGIRELIISNDAKEIRLSIRPCTEPAHRFTIGDAERKIASGETDRPLRQFYELLTNESALRKENYVFFGSGKGYLKMNSSDARMDIGQGHERRQGFTKGIRFIEGPKNNDNRLVTALVLDAKIGTFYKANGLLHTLGELNKWKGPEDVVWNAQTLKRTNTYLRGLRLQFADSKNSFMCSGLDLRDRDDSDQVEYRTLNDCEEKLPGSTKLMPAIDKYKARNIEIKYPSWPVVVQRKLNRPDYYVPLEVLEVSPYQRVPLNKALVEPDKAKRPDERWRLINNHLSTLDLARDTPILHGFGVSIGADAIRTTGFRRPAPSVMYGGVKAMVDPKKVTWRLNNARFKDGAKVNLLIICWNGAEGRPRPGEDLRSVYNEVRNFVPTFMSAATKRGINIQRHHIQEEPTDMSSEVKQANLFNRIVEEQKQLERSGSKGMVFVMYIDPEENKTHGYLKFLEARHQIVTQHVSLRSIRKVNSQKGAATVDNVLAKFNLKAFGLNYTVVPESFAKNEWTQETLFFGYDVWHPTGTSVGERALGFAAENPSVVGFSHNATSDINSFVGDYAFQEPLRERVNDQVLNSRVKWILKHWQKNRGATLPKSIIIYRDGVSEGQYEMVLKELTAICEACDEFEPGYSPDFVVIVVAKRHNKRFFKEDGSGNLAGNPDPLTVVDQEVTRTDITEMYIQSHIPLQGTAKPTQYVLIHSSVSTITQDTLQALTIALTFQHQICTMPVSIPEPVYQSDEWAKRGSEILKVYKENFKLPRKGGNNADRKAPIDWEQMTSRLAYMGKSLDGIRTNA
ncbi:unnamed protein product, partial [Mesorhabditis belari]|uniref:Piwi domain-containing protein n=1 Tax=Mesorhabditis belari TaxID=2138241 RepID=A0AAF3FBL0_9BILA